MPGEPKRVQPSRDRDRAREAERYGACGSFFAPRLVDRSRGRRHDRPDVPVRRLVEVDDHRRVVARPAALAGVAVHPRRLDAIGDRLAGQHQIDPHPEVLMEHPGPVVPVGEDPLVRPAIAHDVAQAERLQLRQRRALGRRSRGSGRRRRPGSNTSSSVGAMFMSPQTTVASGPAATISRSDASQASLYS